MKYRKKPLVVEAWQVVATNGEAPVWLLQAIVDSKVELIPNGRGLYVHTLEGVMTAGLGDWIVQGVQNELYPVKPEIFAATYEPEAA